VVKACPSDPVDGQQPKAGFAEGSRGLRRRSTSLATEVAATGRKARLRGLHQPAKAGFAERSRGFTRQA
jgi:hypothetical protein